MSSNTGEEHSDSQTTGPGKHQRRRLILPAQPSRNLTTSTGTARIPHQGTRRTADHLQAPPAISAPHAEVVPIGGGLIPRAPAPGRSAVLLTANEGSLVSRGATQHRSTGAGSAQDQSAGEAGRGQPLAATSRESIIHQATGASSSDVRQPSGGGQRQSLVTTGRRSVTDPSIGASGTRSGPPGGGGRRQSPETRPPAQPSSRPLQRPQRPSGPKTAAGSTDLARGVSVERSRPTPSFTNLPLAPAAGLLSAAGLGPTSALRDTRPSKASHEKAASEVSRIPATRLENSRAAGPSAIGHPALSPAAKTSGAAGPSNSGPRVVESAVAISEPAGRPKSASGRPGPAIVTRSRSQMPKMRLGIETEFLLAARHSAQRKMVVENFVEELAANYNRKARATGNVYMHSKILQAENKDDYSRWSMVHENSNATFGEPCNAPPILANSNQYLNRSSLTRTFQGALR